MKKILATIAAVVFWASLAWVTFGQAPISNPIINPGGPTWIEWTQLIWAEANQWDSFVNVVKGFINWALGILALLALIIVLWGGFKMVTASGNEEQYKSGFTIMKQAAMWLVIIGVAWFIVSLIFFVINLVANGGVNTSWSTGA